MSDWQSSTEQSAVDTAESLGKQLTEERRRYKEALDALTDMSLQLAAATVARLSAERSSGQARRLLEYALHLSQRGERARVDETWAEFDRSAEAFLRSTPSYPRVQVPENPGKHPAESDEKP